MDILNINLNEAFIIDFNDKQVRLSVFPVPNDSQNVKFGIEAPRDVSVHREEIYLKLQEKLER